LALASWYETPGLVALEAGMSGVPLVLPARGAAPEYFGDYAFYVTPRDRRGIQRAVLMALSRGRSDALADHVRTNFSWEAAAHATVEGYRSGQEVFRQAVATRS
jgi:glycosyltransferase involved in cell wall biosynthesis